MILWERSLHVLCQDLCVTVCKWFHLCAQQFHLPLKFFLLLAEALISAFSALLLKDYPGEAAAQDDPSLLLEDSRGPEGKTHQSTAATPLFFFPKKTD